MLLYQLFCFCGASSARHQAVVARVSWWEVVCVCPSRLFLYFLAFLSRLLRLVEESDLINKYIYACGELTSVLSARLFMYFNHVYNYIS